MEVFLNKTASVSVLGVVADPRVTTAPLSIMSGKMLSSPTSEGLTTLSVLSRQLGESAVRADARDSTMSRAELKVEGRRLWAQIIGDDYQANKRAHDDEKPKTNDPDLLERARLATEYVVKSDQRDHRIKNPFAGLSRDQLNLIVYDETGPYTVNERRAAYYGIREMESQWNHQVMRIYDMEKAAGIANTPQCRAEILAHYRTLPLIEQAEYSDNYESRLEAQINEKPEKPKRSDRTLTLFEVLELMARPRKRGDTKSVMAEVGATVSAGNHQPVSVMKNN